MALPAGPRLAILVHGVAYQAAGEAARHYRALYPDPSFEASGWPSMDSRDQARRLSPDRPQARRQGASFHPQQLRLTDRSCISAAVAALRAIQAVIDGKAVWCDGNGLAIFDKLHSRAYDGEVSL